MDAPLTILRGVVTFKRPLSKKLIFYDLEVADHGAGPADEAATNLWAELLVKADGDLLSQEQARAIRDAVRLGDSVEVTGRHEDPSPSAQAETSGQASALLQQHQHHTFVVQAVRVTARWSEVHPGAHFVPRPAPWSRKPQLQQLEQQPPRPRSPLPVPAGQDAQSKQAASRERGAHLRTEADDANQEQQARAEGQQEAGAGPSSSSYQRLCKYWAATGRCPKGEACQFTHPPARGGASGAQQAFVQSRRAERLAAAAAQGFVHEAGDGAKRRRAAVLAEWLVATYGRDFLNSGTGVMDIAGGRGALTFHLTLHCGVRCTLVEPRRPAALSRQQHRDLVAAGVKAADFRLAQLRVRFGPGLWRRGQQHAQASQSAFEGEGQRLLPACEEGEEAEDEERGQQGEGQAGVSTSTPTEAPADAAELRDEAERLLRGCSLVVGLHPDQATDSILDFALECGKPFAIVPCCVFPRLFPHRRLRQPALDGAEAAGSAVAPGQSGPAAAGSRQSSGTSAVSLAASSPPLSQLHLRSDRGALSGEEQGQEEVPVESYTQLLAYLRQRAEDAAGLMPRARGRRRQTDQRTEQRVEQRHDTIGLQAGGSDLEEPDVAGAQEADAAEAAAVGSTAGTLLWLEEQAGRWEHCTQEAAAAGAWGQWQAEGASAGQAAGGTGDQGQGTVGPAAAARYACVGVAKLPFTGANQVVFALPAEAS